MPYVESLLVFYYCCNNIFVRWEVENNNGSHLSQRSPVFGQKQTYGDEPVYRYVFTI